VVALPINLKRRLRSYVSLLCNALLPPNTTILKKSHLPLDRRIATSSYSYSRHQTTLAGPFFHFVISGNKQKSHRTRTIVHTVSPFGQPISASAGCGIARSALHSIARFQFFRRTDVQGYRRKKKHTAPGLKAALYQETSSRAISPRKVISVRNECNN